MDSKKEDPGDGNPYASEFYGQEQEKVIPPIKKYTMDEDLPWEERYKQLEEHHITEVTWFEKEVLKLRRELKSRMGL